MILRNVKAAELSRMTGIPESYLSRYLSGQTAPKMNGIKLISRALVVNPVYLIGETDEPIMASGEENESKRTLLSLIEQMDSAQLEKTLNFIKDYILK